MGIPLKDGALAFALTLGAGMFTCLGASVVFFPSLVKFANKQFLASSLAVAAGVMIYVSFVEIFQKSLLAFEDAGYPYGMAYTLATVCFFGGIVLGKALNHIAHLVSGGNDVGEEPIDLDTLAAGLEHAHAAEEAAWAEGDSGGGGKLHTPAGEAELVVVAAATPAPAAAGPAGPAQDPLPAPPVPPTAAKKTASLARTSSHGHGHASPRPGGSGGGGAPAATAEARDAQLSKMGMQTALAIGIHNFPEGLATFVATLADPALGVGMAVAIAIHNVPEGLSVSVPIYYATKDRWAAFKWAFISGVSEPVGAALGWLCLYRVMDDSAYGVIFGLVAGMMVNICVKELLPTAFKYDPADALVTNSFVAGMAVMAMSLVLFAAV